MPATFIVGIDLGTTNSVLAYAPPASEKPEVQLLPIPQLVAPGVVETRTTLPSFLYLAPEHEAASGAFDLPWQQKLPAPKRQLKAPSPEPQAPPHAVGELPRRQSAENPQRTVVGAKPWLAHSKVDRHH